MSKAALFSKHSDPIDTADWVHIIEKELGDHCSFDSLAWHAEHNLSVQPFYRREDVDSTGHSSPGNGQVWLIGDQLHTSTADQLEEVAVLAAEGGAELLEVSGCHADSAVRFLARATEPRIPVMFHGGKEFAVAAELYLNAADPSNNPLDVFLVNIFSPASDEKDCSTNLEIMTRLVDLSIDKGGALRVGCLDGRPYRNNGASVSTTVAILLAQLSDWCYTLSERSIVLRDALALCTMIWPVGNSFLLETAGLRALNLLMPQVSAAYGHERRAPFLPHIHATTHLGSFDAQDPFANLICSTTQALAAALGGCESISLAPFDSRVNESKKSPDGRRLARNVLLLLRHEALIDRVNDPISGSYYVEKLTDLVAERAWERFHKMESHGGFRRSIEDGVVEKWVSQDDQFTAQKISKQVNTKGIAT